MNVGYINLNNGGSNSFLLNCFTYAFFLSMYIIFETLRKTFVILIIQNYESRNANCAGLALDPIVDFKYCWQNVVGSNSYASFFDLLVLLGRLKKPLGLGVDDQASSYFELSRFAKRVLLSMPTVLSPSVDNDWGREDRFCFASELKPNDHRSVIPDNLT